MNILVDINHPAHLNFFKNALNILKSNGHNIQITCLKRGKLPQIVKEELYNFDIEIIGNHRNNLLSIIFEANIMKLFQLFFKNFTKKYSLGLSVGSFILGFFCKVKMIPNLQFEDDPECKNNFFFENLTATELYFPSFFDVDGNNINYYNSLKEWAYLSPDYFSPHINHVMELDIEPFKYIFIREVSTGTSNYYHQENNLIASISRDLPSEYNVILSLEDKNTSDQYPDEWIILDEPVKDIHSLIYYSRLLISSGDSMAREGSILGVPSIYCGTRRMAANQIMVEKNILFHIDINDVPEFASRILKNRVNIPKQKEFRNKLNNEWDNITEYIVRQVEEYTEIG